MAQQALTPAVPVASDAEREASSVARKLAASYREMVTIYRDAMKLSPEEALVKASDPGDVTERRDQLLAGDPDQVMWGTLQMLYAQDAEAGHAVWEHLKAAAGDELASGHRAAAAMEWDAQPWERAQFMALRAAFVDEWQPQGGIERALIDTLAQTHSVYLAWLARLHLLSTLECERDDPKLKRQGYWQPPRVDEAQALERAAMMVDRFNRLFLRSLRALRDYRRYAAPSVLVQHAGQVNVGQQQVNVELRDP